MATKVFGMWNFSFSFSVCVCVLHMCEYSWFQKHILFYFLSIIHCGKIECTLHIVGCLPNICCPPYFPTGPDFHLGIWGSRDVDSSPVRYLVTTLQERLWCLPFLFRVKNQSLPTGIQGLMQSGPVTQLHPWQLPHPLSAPLHGPLPFLKYARDAPTSRPL